MSSNRTDLGDATGGLWAAKALRWWMGSGLLRPARGLMAAVVVAAGPWLVSVIALAVVSVTMTPVLGFEAVEDLRLTVIYAFCLAPLAAGPVGATVSRMIGAGLDSGDIGQVPALFLAAAVGSALAAEVLAVVVVMLLGIGPLEVALAFVFLTGAAAMLWTSFAALTALRAYRLLIWSFAGGMALAVAAIMLATRGRVDTETLIWSFTAGIALCVCLALIRLRRAAGGSDGNLVRALGDTRREMRRLWPLALGVLCAITAAWADKWVYWVSPGAARSAAGFAHYSPYDSVMFLAHLSAIPSYAALLVFHDSDLRGSVETFRARLGDRSTYARIRASVDALGQTVWSGVFAIVYLQAALTACMVLMAPALAAALDFSFDQIITLRVGLIAVFLHAFFYLSCAVLLLCNRTRLYLLMQAAFLALNVSASLVFQAQVGLSAYAFFISALVMSVMAFVVAHRALSKFDYLTFLGENDSFYAR
ncbi:exopolysaccharide Pel transporter PelG [Rubellimicrobium roseum]|uniref:Exopolysaccharide Pel transporter PelG n=1 Tax=Rubellimicrobium roseum TaxID=687525 RepID=A0A5C4NJK6_9RHOB|nr:exopolysaccharide Pel transporter PelG [Rubellimicrobium roseum]TNC74981.1 hypothetical protein FHG71_02330 [Rubellimicrobium roseum]